MSENKIETYNTEQTSNINVLENYTDDQVLMQSQNIVL